MRKKGRSRTVRDLIIDLTPLLDVIFIMLIIVLANGDVFSQTAADQMEEARIESQNARQIKDEADQKVNAYQTHFESYEDIDRFFSIITVSAAYDLNNRRNRTVKVKINDDDEMSYELNPSNTKDKWGEFKDLIEGKITQAPELPVVLALNMKNEDRMLYRDEQDIQRIFDELRTKYPNVTVRW